MIVRTQKAEHRDQQMYFFRRLALFWIMLLIPALCPLSSAKADIKVDITRGTVEPIPIAIPAFYGAGGNAQFGRDIAQVVSNDLVRSGLFSAVDPKSFIQDMDSLLVQPRFADWRVLNAQAVVVGRVEAQPDGRLKVEYRLWDVFGESQMTGLAYFTVPNNWRRVAHIIADSIYKRITGEDGYFDTRIVFVSETGIATNRVKRPSPSGFRRATTSGRSVSIRSCRARACHAISSRRRADFPSAPSSSASCPWGLRRPSPSEPSSFSS